MSVCLSVHLSLCLSVRPHGIIWLPLETFHDISLFVFFLKSVEKFQVSLKSDKNKAHFTCRSITFMTKSG